MSEVVFDFPTGFAAVEVTDPQHHHERCSYRQADRGLLCDCAAIHAARRAYELGVQHAREGRPVTVSEWQRYREENPDTCRPDGRTEP